MKTIKLPETSDEALNQKIDDLTAKYQALSDRLDAILPSSASPGAALRAIPSAIRSEVSRANGKKGGRPKKTA